MSLYNAICGYSSACVFILPLLGRRMSEYPRFRDCYVTEDENIAVFTRVGGDNRGEGFGETELYKDENFLDTFDDDFDSTYGTYVFKCPDKWKADFDKLLSKKFNEVSDEYLELIGSFYPQFVEDGTLKKLFRGEKENVG